MIATHPLCLTLSLRALVEHHDVLLLGAATAEQPRHRELCEMKVSENRPQFPLFRAKHVWPILV